MKKILSALLLLSMVFGITAFECASTELTSARLYLQQKKIDKAKEALYKEVRKNPKADEAYFLLGNSVFGPAGQFDSMAIAFDKSLAISPKFKDNIAQSRLFYWAENFNKGAENWGRSNNAEEPEKVNEYATKAIQNFEDAIICNADSANTYKNLIVMHKIVGNVEKTFPLYDKVIELEPTPAIYADYGGTYNQIAFEHSAKFKKSKDKADSIAAKKNYTKALEILDEGSKLGAFDVSLFQELANAYIGLNRTSDALAQIKNLIDDNPNDVNYRYFYGSLLLQEGKFAQAEKSFIALLEIEPEYKDGIYQLIATYNNWARNIREEAEAKEDFENEDHLVMLEKALPLVEKYLDLDPETSIVWDIYGKILTIFGRTEEAMEAFDKADMYK